MSLYNKALITGITGQDGSYLAELLLKKDYIVYGMVRRNSTDNTERIKHLMDNPAFMLVYGDLSDYPSLLSLLEKTTPSEIYNLASQSDVGLSFKLPEMTGDITGMGVLRILEATRKTCPSARFYQASSSELFGKVQEIPQKESTPFYPRSPYGVAKLYGFWATKNYREAYDLHASNGILFNHESPRRGENFVTRKVIKQLVQIFKRERECVYLGNLDSKRDWGFAGDYVEAMWKMLQMKEPDDYVIATGETHSIRELVEETGRLLGMEIAWRGAGYDEEGYDTKTKDVVVKINPEFWRPAEVDILVGDTTKATEKLGWTATTRFHDLIKIMVDAELACYR